MRSLIWPGRGMLALLVAGAMVPTLALPQELAAPDPDVEAIRRRVESYVAAFNAQDAQRLAEHWLPEAVYVNPVTGRQVHGRRAIVEEFRQMFATLGKVKLVVEVESIRLLSPHVALERGRARVVYPDGNSDLSRYTAVHVKQGEQWFLDRVSEQEVYEPPSRYEKLKELEWMVGTWIDEAEDGVVKTTCRWSRNRNFLIRFFDVLTPQGVELAGMQLITWDPNEKQIRSWVFDSDGGFGQGRWTRRGNRWIVTVTSTLPQGGKAAAVNIITRVDENRFRWKSINRTARGRPLPNLPEVTIVRISPHLGGDSPEEQ